MGTTEKTKHAIEQTQGTSLWAICTRSQRYADMYLVHLELNKNYPPLLPGYRIQLFSPSASLLRHNRVVKSSRPEREYFSTAIVLAAALRHRISCSFQAYLAASGHRHPPFLVFFVPQYLKLPHSILPSPPLLNLLLFQHHLSPTPIQRHHHPTTTDTTSFRVSLHR